MPKKAPRRTAQRILETALDLFNRFGEPNVSTTLIAAELGISPGNLYYHYPAKDALINRLQDAHDAELRAVLDDGASAREVEDALALVHALLALTWRYRFLHRDRNDLLSKNRQLETRVQSALASQQAALQALLDGLRDAGHLGPLTAQEGRMLARSMVVLAGHWLDDEYARNPREALEPAHAQQALREGTRHVLQLLVPYLPPAQRARLAEAQADPAAADAPATARPPARQSTPDSPALPA